MLIATTFDTSSALAGMFLWITFSYLATMLNCDLQRTMQKHPLFMHLMGFTAFFFLFTLVGTSNATSIGVIFLKSIAVYVLFILITKSKWFFVLPVLAILLLDQILKKWSTIKLNNYNSKVLSVDDNREDEKLKLDLEVSQQEKISKCLMAAVVVLIIIGSLQYMHYQYKDHAKFSFYKFFFTNSKCHVIGQ